MNSWDWVAVAEITAAILLAEIICEVTRHYLRRYRPQETAPGAGAPFPAGHRAQQTGMFGHGF